MTNSEVQYYGMLRQGSSSFVAWSKMLHWPPLRERRQPDYITLMVKIVSTRTFTHCLTGIALGACQTGPSRPSHQTCGVQSTAALSASGHLLFSASSGPVHCDRVINYENVTTEKTKMEILSDTDNEYLVFFFFFSVLKHVQSNSTGSFCFCDTLCSLHCYTSRWRQVTVFINEVLIHLFVLFVKKMLIISGTVPLEYYQSKNRQSHISQSPTNDRTKVIHF